MSLDTKADEEFGRKITLLISQHKFPEVRERLSQSEKSLPTLRSYLYNGFLYLNRTNRKKAEELVGFFRDYEISPWLTSAQI